MYFVLFETGYRLAGSDWLGTLSCPVSASLGLGLQYLAPYWFFGHLFYTGHFSELWEGKEDGGGQWGSFVLRNLSHRRTDNLAYVTTMAMAVEVCIRAFPARNGWLHVGGGEKADVSVQTLEEKSSHLSPRKRIGF